MVNEKQNVDFKLLSLNVRGIRSPSKRKAIFLWLEKQKQDIIFLQETYSTPEVESTWKTQWKGKKFFAHGTNHSCGVMILVREDLEFELKALNADCEGRYILLEAVVQGSNYTFVNIYAPNKVQQQSVFFRNLNDALDLFCVSSVFTDISVCQSRAF